MLFRLRHLNTGRLVVQQEIEYNGNTIRTIGLSEHYPEVSKMYINKAGKQTVHMPLTQEQTEAIKKMESNSIFRLVSTGVDTDNRIRSGTSVQIQHFDTKSFLIMDTTKYTEIKEEENSSDSIKTANVDQTVHFTEAQDQSRESDLPSQTRAVPGKIEQQAKTLTAS